ncbi:MAG: hypothetical protein LBQ18_05995 [Campylobacteraceae bacterium]|nr:hypothetical protein [Campylobacteraceae bacterium]
MKAIVTALCVFYALTFNGCVQKEYIAIPCTVEAPQRLYRPIPCVGDDFTFAKCVISKKEALEADYSRLLNAFEACR